ncbi:Rieske (2Fe-2S) protein [Mangrovibacterium lignilyticum]|uniref:Rieske (2Fe-2S) protein n=1 Tax=Mangrovibacterium lignilyticum TaxID=2668052 RepID=UPI0013D823C6|nr:Rieske 2Fe-2S domain-containing protein [Mangrovibacterium lignilyticum]
MKNIEVCTVEECNSLGKKVLTIDGQEILLIHSDGEYFAVDNICPHARTRLISGRVEEGTLTCSNHGACFDLKTGEIRVDKIDEDLLEQIDVDNLPFGPLKTYPLQITNGMIVITV